MGVVELPANIKQIGSIGDGLRIYMEDYVCSYLQQYAAAGGYDERLALLIGRCMVIDGQRVLFISGAVQGRYIKIENGMSSFTQRSMDYAGEMIKKYFKGMEIVGWAQSQPSYGVFLNTSYAEYHINSFKEDHDVLYVIDPVEKINCFYTYGQEFSPRSGEPAAKMDGKELVEAPGYFIYYEKNRGMHEYMLENRADQDLALKLPIEPEPEDETGSDDIRNEDEYQPEVMIKNRQSMRSLKKITMEQKRVLNLLVTLSAVLFIICFIMGAGLIQNQDRISNMENQLVQLSTSYRNLLMELRDNTRSVFAANPDVSSQLDETETASAQTPEPSVHEQAVLIHEDGNANLEDSASADQTVAQAEPEMEFAANEEPLETADYASEALTPVEPQSVEASSQESVSIWENVPDTYTVQEGDTLSYISNTFYGTGDMVEKIRELNGLTDDRIYYGKVLKLPK